MNIYRYVIRVALINDRNGAEYNEIRRTKRFPPFTPEPYTLDEVEADPRSTTKQLGYMYDHKSCTALVAAVKAGCFGPVSRDRFVIHFVEVQPNGDYVGKTQRLFGRNSAGQVTALIPTASLLGWTELASAKSTRRRLRLERKAKSLGALKTSA